MNPVEFFEATVVDPEDTDLAFKLVMIPGRALSVDEFEPYELAESATTVLLENEPGAGRFLPNFLAATFMPRDFFDGLEARPVRDLLESSSNWIHAEGSRGDRVIQFTAHLAYAEVLPVQSSPLDAKSLASVVQSASTPGVGGALGYLLAGDTAMAFILVPVGVVLAGPLWGLSRALEQGVYERVLEAIRRGQGQEAETR